MTRQAGYHRSRGYGVASGHRGGQSLPGLRLSEAVALDVDDLQLSVRKRVIAVRAGKTATDGRPDSRVGGVHRAGSLPAKAVLRKSTGAFELDPPVLIGGAAVRHVTHTDEAQPVGRGEGGS